MQHKTHPNSKAQTRTLATLICSWLPFLVWSRSLNRPTIIADLMAGLTGAIVVLPQGVAYALIAGLPPEYGLYTAIITPVVAGLFGSSLHLISGPTAAISIVVLSVVSNVATPGSVEFIPAVLTLTLMAGLVQFALGFARLGTLVNFISHTVVIGFTAGAAILIATSQLKYALGLSVPAGSSFVASWQALLSQLNLVNPYSITIALATIAATLLIKKINSRLPAMLIGMIVGSLTCWLLNGAQHQVPLVGALPAGLPDFSLPDLSAGTLSALLPGAVAVAILGLVEAVSIAKAIGIRSGQRIDGNQEFVGQGLSNIVGSFFSCYAGSGSFTRSGVNYDSGAQTPLAAIFAALILVLILLFAPDITALLPLPAMAGAILLIAWNLIDTHHIQEILKSSKQEAAVLTVTFVATLTVELEFSIYLGVILSLVLYLKRTSQPRIMEVAPKSIDQGTELRSVQRFELSECPGIKILRIDGSIFFGAVDHIERKITELCKTRASTRHLVIFGVGVNFIDLSGAEMLQQMRHKLEEKGCRLSICGLKNTVIDELESYGFVEKIGSSRLYPTIDAALEDTVDQLQQLNSPCLTCDKRIFNQCPG